MQVKRTTTTTTSLFSHFEKLRINTFINYKNKIGEHWLPRITEELIMIGSQFVYMLTKHNAMLVYKENIHSVLNGHVI